MRADARKNYEHILDVARMVVREQGVDASLRDIARRAGVGLGTLYRHFPTREALLETLLRTSLETLTRRASALEAAAGAAEALESWFAEAVEFTHSYSGVVALMAAALEDPSSALHASCTCVRADGARLLAAAQRAGAARDDLDGIELLALVAAVAWLKDQPSFAAHADHLRAVVVSAVLRPGASGT